MVLCQCPIRPACLRPLRLWLWKVAGIGITRPEGSVHKGQIYYRCLKHLSEANALRYVMGVPLIVEPAGLFLPASAGTGAPLLPEQAGSSESPCHPKHIQLLRSMLTPGALTEWVSKESTSDPEGWQRNLTLRIIDACRAVPDASVPNDLLVGEPIITGSLELMMQSVVTLLGEAVKRLKSLESAAEGTVSLSYHSAALSSASDAAAREKGKAVEDECSRVKKLWLADQASLKEKVKELEAQITAQGNEVKGLKANISNTTSDFSAVNAERDAAVKSARAELQRRHDSENASLCTLVSQMANHLQVILPKWGGGTQGQASGPGAVPVPEAEPEKPSFPEDLTNRDNVKKCLSKWTTYFTDHALRVTRTDLKKIMSLLGMIEAYKALQCPGQCLTCEGKISLVSLPDPDGKWKGVQHLDSEGEPTGVKAGECDPKGVHNCPLCENIAFEHSDHCIGMCPLKPDRVAALVGHKSTLGYITSAASTEKTRADNKAKKARKKEADKLAQKKIDDKKLADKNKQKSTKAGAKARKGGNSKPNAYDQREFNEAWKGATNNSKGYGRGDKYPSHKRRRSDNPAWGDDSA